MRFRRHGHRLLVAFAVGAAAVAAVGRVAIAVAAPDQASPEDQRASTDESDGGDEAGDAVPVPPAEPVPSVAIGGGVVGVLASTGEARTTWRYGRARGLAVDETVSRVRVTGSGRSTDGLHVGFSVAILLPALRAGTYAASPVTGVASAWAREDRQTVAPDLEWDAAGHDGGPSSFVVTVASFGETDHSSEQRGGVAVDVTEFRVHGVVEATLPCTRSVASLRPRCRSETLRGTF